MNDVAAASAEGGPGGPASGDVAVWPLVADAAAPGGVRFAMLADDPEGDWITDAAALPPGRITLRQHVGVEAMDAWLAGAEAFKGADVSVVPLEPEKASGTGDVRPRRWAAVTLSVEPSVPARGGDTMAEALGLEGVDRPYEFGHCRKLALDGIAKLRLEARWHANWDGTVAGLPARFAAIAPEDVWNPDAAVLTAKVSRTAEGRGYAGMASLVSDGTSLRMEVGRDKGELGPGWGPATRHGVHGVARDLADATPHVALAELDAACEAEAALREEAAKRRARACALERMRTICQKRGAIETMMEARDGFPIAVDGNGLTTWRIEPWSGEAAKVGHEGAWPTFAGGLEGLYRPVFWASASGHAQMVMVPSKTGLALLAAIEAEIATGGGIATDGRFQPRRLESLDDDAMGRLLDEVEAQAAANRETLLEDGAPRPCPGHGLLGDVDAKAWTPPAGSPRPQLRVVKGVLRTPTKAKDLALYATWQIHGLTEGGGEGSGPQDAIPTSKLG